ncbi:MAG: biotin--[acetyl-CoA-carboxylase] ligase [Chitinispirillales bacterium]|nr:biotin--[acetyl-CoA-carboxylase] ligase [Chitinispirillales bacterium]
MDNRRYIYLDEVDSTNTYAKSLAKPLTDFSDGGQLLIIRAGKQSGGRGRGDKAFFSNHQGGLWASIIAPISDISKHFEHNRAVSLAILESLKKIDSTAPISIKWPNDIYWGGKKVTGVLLENSPENPNVIIIGFGVNVNISNDDLPKDLRERATSVLIETGREQSLDQLLGDIISGYQKYINIDPPAVHKLYSSHLYKKGHAAIVDGHAGTFVIVELDGRIALDTARGRVFCHSGTLQFLPEQE